MAKGGGGKALSGILCFILGFIIAIVAEIAVIAGGVYWLMRTDLDTIFNTVGIDNTTENEDGSTSYVYINTSEVATLSELISALQDIAGKGTAELTLNDLENVFPIADRVVDTVYSSCASIFNMSDEEVRDLIEESTLKSTAIGSLPTYLRECFYGLEMAQVFQIAGIDVESSTIYMAMSYGAPAGTIVIDGTTYVLYSETLTSNQTEEDDGTESGTESGNEQNSAASAQLTADGTSADGSAATEEEVIYYLSDGSVLNSAYYDYIYSVGSTYKLYYYVIGDTAYVAQRNSYGEETRYSQVTTDDSSLLVYSQYDAETAEYSGAYYYDENDELVVLSARTLNDMVEEGVDDMFYDLYITDLMSEDADPLLLEALDGVSLGALLNGEAETSDILYDINITDMLEDDADPLMRQLFDGVSIGDLMTGDMTIDELMNRLYIPDILDTDVDNGIMAFISYSLTDVTALDADATGNTFVIGTDEETGDDITATYTYTATLHLYTEVETQSTDENDEPVYDSDGNAVMVTSYTEEKVDAYIVVSEGLISGVYYYAEDEDGNPVLTEYSGVTVGDIDEQIDRLMDTLTIGDMIDTDGSTILGAIAGSTINSLSEDIQNLTVQELFYDNIYTEAAASGVEYVGETAVTVESYLKVVYENVKTLSGTFYLCTTTTVTTTNTGNENNETTVVTTAALSVYSATADDTTFEAYINGDKDPTETTVGNVTTAKSYSIYWAAAGSTTLYEVVLFSQAYLYYEYDSDGSLAYVEYETTSTTTTDGEGNEVTTTEVIKGHLSNLGNYTGGGIIYTYGEAQGAWYFMLNVTTTTESEGKTTSTTCEVAYAVDDISELVTNTKDNIQGATLKKLVETGMLTNESLVNNINSTITISDPSSDLYSYNGKTLGSLTLNETISFFITLLSTSSILSSGN